MDPDIVEVPAFGEGFNTGLTIGANIPLRQNLVATLGTGHTWRGTFNRETPYIPPLVQDTFHFSPGDVSTVNAALYWQPGAWVIQGSFTYLVSQRLSADSLPVMKPGAQFSASLAGSYQISRNWSATGDVSWSFSGKNLVNTGGFLLTPELLNSNSNVVTLDLTPTYSFDRGTVGSTLSVLYRDHNAYQIIQAAYSPAKTRIAFGGQARIALGSSTALNLQLTHVWTDEGNMLFPPGIPVVTKSAWNASVGTTLTF